MDPQPTTPQSSIPVSQPVPQHAKQPQKKYTFLWIIAGVVILLIGIVIGMFLMRPT